MTDEWEPGDPLHSRSPLRDHFFNFRIDLGHWKDAASWPNPSEDHRLPHLDEFEAFIIEWKQERRSA